MENDVRETIDKILAVLEKHQQVLEFHSGIFDEILALMAVRSSKSKVND